MSAATIPRPDRTEYEPHNEAYVSKVPAGHLLMPCGTRRSLCSQASTPRRSPGGLRALAYVIAGHERHHVAILRECYLA